MHEKQKNALREIYKINNKAQISVKLYTDAKYVWYVILITCSSIHIYLHEIFQIVHF